MEPDRTALGWDLVPELAAPPDVAVHPAVRATRRLAAGLLVPQAQHVDVHGVGRGHVDALAAAGLLGLDAPVAAGGAGVLPAVAREVAELLGGACGTTWFVATQHGRPAQVAVGARSGTAAAAWGPRLASGAALAGVAFTHVRRPGPPPVRATRAAGDDGWCVDGRVDWCTSWGLADVVLLAAQADGPAADDPAAGDDPDVVLALVDARGQPGLTASEPLRLTAMGGTRTVALRLDGLHVPDDRVVAVVARSRFLAADAATVANATPALFGLTRAVLARLRAVGAGRGEAALLHAADRLAARAADLRAQAYRLRDEVPVAEALDERVSVRGEACALAVRAAAALVAAVSGRGMSLDQPAQRHAREALFHLVQAQTAPVRAAQVAALAR